MILSSSLSMNSKNFSLLISPSLFLPATIIVLSWSIPNSILVYQNISGFFLLSICFRSSPAILALVCSSYQLISYGSPSIVPVMDISGDNAVFVLSESICSRLSS